MQLEITNFIHTTPCWEEKLVGAPYFVKAKRLDNLVLLRYNQINSDMTLPIVRECRGIILDSDDNFRPVCVPFLKFGNFGEIYVPEIDWSTAQVQEKLDGSIMKLWHYKGEWRVSSNSEIDARNANVNSALLVSDSKSNLYDLFTEAWAKTGVSMDHLDPRYTYMFELTSPHNRVVVQYEELFIRHIGTRDNRTLLECNLDIGIPKPRTFPMTTLGECIAAAHQLDYDHEGYVVVDAQFNRVKVKSPRYVAINHMVQGVTTQGNIIEIIARGEQDEFLSYFPEFGNVFGDMLRRINEFAAMQESALREILATPYDSRKEMAAAVTQTSCPACLFALIDKKAASARDWLLSRPTAKILGLIGLAS